MLYNYNIIKYTKDNLMRFKKKNVDEIICYWILTEKVALLYKYRF